MWFLISSRPCLRQCRSSLSRYISNVTSTQISNTNKAWPSSSTSSSEKERLSINSRLEDFRLSASFYGSPGPLLELPSFPKAVPLIEPLSPLTVLKGDPLRRREELIEDPVVQHKEIKEPGKQISKWAHRMLRIKKRKMKVHQRKKRWRKNKVFYTTRIFNRVKSREIAFRTALLDKIRTAESFNAEAYVQDYLQTFRTPLTPLTYEGRRHPVWLIKELLIQDELKKKRALDIQLNMLSKKPLVHEGETVEDFVKRISPQIDIYKI